MTCHNCSRRLPTAVLVFALLLVLPPALAGEDSKEATNLKEAFSEGKLLLSLRYRYEWVSDDAFDEDGQASTLRTALGFKTAPLHGLSALLEFENVASIGAEDRHNNKGDNELWNGVDDRPVIADPQITEVNQTYIEAAFSDTSIKAGRQRILLDDVRFVGNVGWRQNHQTFDAVSVTNKSLSHTTLFYGYVKNVNNILGGDRGMSSHLLQGTFAQGAALRVNLFGYLLDYDDLDQSKASTSTFGAKVNGLPKLGDDWKLAYDVTYAKQQDYADNPGSIDADYYRLEAGVHYKSFYLHLAQEVLGGGDDGAFATPLATLHKWNGWADKFMKTPPDGLKDTYLAIGGKQGAFAFRGVYHDFSADSGSADYGTEIDLLATFNAPWKELFGLKAAAFRSDGFSTDTTKLWLFTAYSF